MDKGCGEDTNYYLAIYPKNTGIKSKITHKKNIKISIPEKNTSKPIPTYIHIYHKTHNVSRHIVNQTHARFSSTDAHSHIHSHHHHTKVPLSRISRLRKNQRAMRWQKTFTLTIVTITPVFRCSHTQVESLQSQLLFFLCSSNIYKSTPHSTIHNP